MKLDRAKLMRAREMLGYGLEKTAEEAGVSKNSVLRAEHEEDIRPVTARKIAGALGVRVADLLEADYPKAESRSSLEPSLFSGIEDERRESVYGPWLEFVNRYADRWDMRIEAGDFDLGSFNEFVGVVEELIPVLKELNARELREFPAGVPDTFGGREALTGQAIWRISDLLNPMAEVGATKFANSELEQFRHKRESLEQWGRAASG